MNFTAHQMKETQERAVLDYEDKIKEEVLQHLIFKAQNYPYSDKTTFIFANESKRHNVRLERPEVIFVSLNIFTKDMFHRIADWLAKQGYMTRFDWFAEENNNNGDIGHIAINW